MLNDGVKITRQNLMEDVWRNSGKAGGWPNYFTYSLDGESITLSVDHRTLNKKVARGLDPWSLALLVAAEAQCGIAISSVKYAIHGEVDDMWPHGRLMPNLEAFRRRVSFLNMNNSDIQFTITINGVGLSLDNPDELFHRPKNEIVRQGSVRVAQDNHPGRLEKDFQTWLFANEVRDAEGATRTNTNERLAVLGDDFFRLKKKAFGIDREFPTGAFHERVSSGTRVLPTEFVDIVTLNKYGRLAIIELKLNDSQLEVMAQIMDYALFFRCYIDNLLPVIKEKLGSAPTGKAIMCYVVNNHFHDRFDDVAKYYGTKNRGYGFGIVKVVLGAHAEVA